MPAVAAKKIIIVTGATGKQGSSVANTFLKLPHWHVRALTRNPSSDASKQLAARGAEVVYGNLAEPACLAKAFENANAIFLNTIFWETYYPAKAALDAEGKPPEPAGLKAFAYETTSGQNAADAAAAVPTLEILVYSNLSPFSKGSMGKYNRSMYSNAKNQIVEYIETKQPALAKKMSLIYAGAYTENSILNPSFDPNSGKYIFRLPLKEDTRMPIIDPKESIGPFVRALVEDEPPGVKLLAYDSYLSMRQVVDEWSKASGKEAILVPITTQELHEKMGVPWELLDGLNYATEFGYMAGIDNIIEPHQLKSKVSTKSYKEYLKERDWDKVLSA